jgi:hypothetical protein
MGGVKSRARLSGLAEGSMTNGKICKHCGNLIDYRSKWAGSCLYCDRGKGTRRDALARSLDEYTDYNSEKAKIWRDTFHERDSLGRSWTDFIRDWKIAHPEYRKLGNLYAAKSKKIAKLKLKMLLVNWGLSNESARRLLRLVAIQDLDCLVDCLKSWDERRGSAHRSFHELLRVTRVEACSRADSNNSNNQNPAVSKKAIGQANKPSSGFLGETG